MSTRFKRLDILTFWHYFFRCLLRNKMLQIYLNPLHTPLLVLFSHFKEGVTTVKLASTSSLHIFINLPLWWNMDVEKGKKKHWSKIYHKTSFNYCLSNERTVPRQRSTCCTHVITILSFPPKACTILTLITIVFQAALYNLLIHTLALPVFF